ncbi:MAG: DUF3368 domain-containing protein [Bacteroidota bacterium]
MVVISDTTAISNLYKIGKLNYLKLLFREVIIPNAVYDELLGIEQSGYDISEIKNAEWLIKAKVNDSQLLSKLHLDLDTGESEAIALAQERKCDFLIIDEKKGRKIAEALGIKTIGIIGILIQLKREKIIHRVKPILDDLRENAGFWISEKLYHFVLESEKE